MWSTKSAGARDNADEGEKKGGVELKDPCGASCRPASRRRLQRFAFVIGSQRRDAEVAELRRDIDCFLCDSLRSLRLRDENYKMIYLKWHWEGIDEANDSNRRRDRKSETRDVERRNTTTGT